jgi:hypothetical protein
MNKKYNFVRPVTDTKEDLCYKPDACLTKFHQICLFKHPTTSKYSVRRFIVDENGNFTSVKEYKLTQKQLDKFRIKLGDNDYKCYSTYDLSQIEYPHDCDILVARSNMFSNMDSYGSYANF